MQGYNPFSSSESEGNFAEGAQPWLTRAALQVRNMLLVDAGLFGKVNLLPVFCARSFLSRSPVATQMSLPCVHHGLSLCAI